MNKIEVYSKEWCPYCAKAKSLLKTKQLDFDEIDITSDADGESQMIRRSRRRTVPQIFIDDKPIGGYDDLANLNATGALDKLLGREPTRVSNKVYDVIVVGAGPAGMSAAIYAVRKNLSTLIIAGDIGGQLGTTYEVGNYPGFDLISGPDLVQRFSEHVDQYGVERLIGEQVTGIHLQGNCKILTTTSGRELMGRSVIVASGAHKRRLNIPGEKELAGRGVVYCSTCDGPFFNHQFRSEHLYLRYQIFKST